MTDFSDELVALVCAYQEAALLPGMLGSLKGKVDRVVVADGRYRMYPGEGGPSTDGTIEIALEAGCELIESPPEGWETEHQKRTALVDACRLGDECLVIDADERLRGGESLRDRYGDFRLQVVGVDGTPGKQDAVRLFMYRPGLHYRFHFGLYTAGNRNVLLGRDRLPEAEVRIDHLHHLRTPERVESDKEYEAELVPFEASLGAYGGR